MREPWAPFASAWDAALANHGPATLFTLDPKGLLRADAERTREASLGADALPNAGGAHYIARDRATGLLQYLYVTNPQLARGLPRADATLCDSAQAAQALVAAQWTSAPVKP